MTFHLELQGTFRACTSGKALIQPLRVLEAMPLPMWTAEERIRLKAIVKLSPSKHRQAIVTPNPRNDLWQRLFKFLHDWYFILDAMSMAFVEVRAAVFARAAL